jgi:hypothetical protein
MPYKIKTDSIVDPSIQQPFTGKSLNFLQQWNEDSNLAIIRAIIGDDNYGIGPFALFGLKDTGTNPVVNIAAGYMLYDGELFGCSGLSTTLTGSNVVVCTVTETFDMGIDPVTFTDLVPRNVHSIRNVVLSQGLTGTADFDYSSMTFIQSSAPKSKRVPIGDWNMDSTQTKNVAHGLPDMAKITSVSAMIVADTGAIITDLTANVDATTVAGGATYITATNIVLERITGGYYDQAGYDQTPYNRGYVTIWYVD